MLVGCAWLKFTLAVAWNAVQFQRWNGLHVQWLCIALILLKLIVWSNQWTVNSFKCYQTSDVTCASAGLRRLPLTPWESNVVNRLQQPTHSYLARSCSAVSLSGDQTGNTHTHLCSVLSFLCLCSFFLMPCLSSKHKKKCTAPWSTTIPPNPHPVPDQHLSLNKSAERPDKWFITYIMIVITSNYNKENKERKSNKNVNTSIWRVIPSP